MLDRDPSKRLGRAGVHEIKEHPFFKAIDWEVLRGETKQKKKKKKREREREKGKEMTGNA
jgi:hypothetical protein